jgi:hypothetical protein
LTVQLGGVFATQTHLVVNGPLVLLIARIPRVNSQAHLPVLQVLLLSEMILFGNLARKRLDQLAHHRSGKGGMVSAYELIMSSMSCGEWL